MSLFDVVAEDPHKGDKLCFAGGLLTYEAVTSLDGDPSLVAERVTTHREVPYERRKTVPIHKEVWGDLVRRAATVERGPSA